MPNRDVHDVTGALAGEVTALYRSNGQTDGARLLEAFGGIGGGMAGSRLPDILDPPTSPAHRKGAHSVVAAALVQLCAARVPEWQQKCRELADRFAVRRRECVAGSLDEFVFALAEMFCRMAAGFLAGLPAGHGTHLGLDAFTPAGINLI